MSDSDHFDDRSKSTSTSKILNKMSGKSLAEDLLDPNSLVRKKKDTEQFFNDICYIVRMEELKIDRDVIIYLQKTEELAYAEMDSYLYSLSKTSLDAINLNMEKDRLLISKEQLRRLSEFNERLNKMLERLADTLKQLDGFIGSLKTTITKLENDLSQIRNQFCENWSQIFDLPNIKNNFEDIQIYLASEKYNQLLKDQHHDGYITFDHDMYFQLAQAVEKEVKSGNHSLLSLDAIIQDKATDLVQKKLQEESSSLMSAMSTQKRNDWMKEIMALPSTKQAILEIKSKMLKVVLNDSFSMQNIRDSAVLEIDLAEKKAIVAVQERRHEHLLAYGFELKNIQDLSNDLSNSLPQVDNDFLMGKNIDALEMLTGNLSNEFDLISSKLDERVMQCNFMIACGDDAVSGLGIIATMADECQQNVNALKEIKDGLPDLTASTSEKFEEMFLSVMETIRTESELAKMAESKLGKGDDSSSPSLR